jgi:hypothetical protein
MIKNLDVVGALSSKIFSEQINIGDPPPPPPTFSLFRFYMALNCPIFTRILHDYLYLNNKLRTFSLFAFFISHFTNTYGFSFEKTNNIFANCIFVRIREIFKTNRETWRSARKPGDSRVNRETWQLWVTSTISIIPCPIQISFHNSRYYYKLQ